MVRPKSRPRFGGSGIVQSQSTHTLEICQENGGGNVVAYHFVVEGSVTFDGGGTDQRVFQSPGGYTIITGMIKVVSGRACRPYTIDGKIISAWTGDGPHQVLYDGQDVTGNLSQIVEEPSTGNGGSNGGTNGGSNGGSNGGTNGGGQKQGMDIPPIALALAAGAVLAYFL